MSLLVAASVALAAGEAGNGDSPADPWLRLAEFGFLGVFCWYGITKALPRMQANYQTEAAESRKHYQEEAAESRKHYSGIIDKLVARQEADRIATREDRIATRDVLQQMIKHCAQESARIRTQGD